MNYTVVVFSVRSDTMKFYNKIKNYGLYCSIINTPRSLASSCGVSVKIDKRLVHYTMGIIKALGLFSFKGVFEINYFKGQEIINKLI